ncbi:MAG: Gfo/Idh/MocA family oxidoreductase [Clostridia bacterium]|nr:Gfo/Idh/MocA family oxidoreductase [Clostridia bacterium]
MIKAVIIGFSHMHVNEVALYITEHPEYKLCAISDAVTRSEDENAKRYTPLWNFSNVKNNYCSNYYEDYKEMLDTEKPDIAFVLTENAQKYEVVSECARRGINLSVEKPVAMNLDEAEKMLALVEKSKIECYVNWPVLWRPYVLKMKKALDEGYIGKPLKLRYINGHTGPLGKGAKHRGVSENAQEMTDTERGETWWHKSENGGGVFLDICCYGCFFSRWFFGDGAKSVYASGQNFNTPFGNTEDDFAAIIKYDGQMTVAEGTWITPRAVIPSGPSLLGTDGILVCTGGAENAPDIKCYDIYGKEIDLPEFTFEDKYKNMPALYADHIVNGTPMHEMVTLKANVDVMKLLSAAIESNGTGKEILL